MSLKITMLLPLAIFAVFFAIGIHAFYTDNQELGLRLWGGITLVNAIVAVVEYLEKRGKIGTNIFHSKVGVTFSKKDQMLFALMYSGFALICMVSFFLITQSFDNESLLLLMLMFSLIGFMNLLPTKPRVDASSSD